MKLQLIKILKLLEIMFIIIQNLMLKTLKLELIKLDNESLIATLNISCILMKLYPNYILLKLQLI